MNGTYTLLEGGAEGKYFYQTIEQASAMSRANYASQGAQTITSIEVPQSVLNSAYVGRVAGEGQIVFLPGSSFPLGPVNVWTYTPVSF